MRITNTQVLNEKLPLPEQIRILQMQIGKLYTCLQGRVSFGTGVDGTQSGNIEGEWQAFTSDGVADTEFSVTHTLGSVPLGYLVVAQSKAGSLYATYPLDGSGTAWSSTTVALKCNVASVKFLVFLVKAGPSGSPV